MSERTRERCLSVIRHSYARKAFRDARTNSAIEPPRAVAVKRTLIWMSG